MSFYNNARIITSPFFRLVFGVKRTGMENQPENGGVIICSNHRSNFDPLILGASLRYDLKFMAKAELFKNPFVRWLITRLGAFPINRGKGDTVAIERATKILNGGGALLMFPEGHRNKEGESIKRFQSGVARLAFKTHAAVLPVAIVTKGAVRPFKRNEVRAARPLQYDELGFTDGSIENMREVSRRLHDAVLGLMNRPPEHKG